VRLKGTWLVPPEADVGQAGAKPCLPALAGGKQGGSVLE
jgi:hypothetical protein